MKHRELDLTKYSGVSVHNNVYTFPLWNLLGQMVGYQQYRPDMGKGRTTNPKDMRYYTYLPKHTNTAWGLETLNTKKPYLLVVEGVFDAVKLHNAGVNALAVLANDPKPLKRWLDTLGYLIVPVCDGDAAGKKLAKLTNCDKVEYLPEGFDVGDMSGMCVEEVFGKYAK
jgi:hypothetical protein